MEKYNEFAGIVSESEIDEMLEENTTGAGFTTFACVTAITAVVTFFAGCPTTACTDDCRL